VFGHYESNYGIVERGSEIIYRGKLRTRLFWRERKIGLLISYGKYAPLAAAWLGTVVNISTARACLRAIDRQMYADVVSVRQHFCFERAQLRANNRSKRRRVRSVEIIFGKRGDIE